jgi:ABC-type Fe3+-hydroxamate transport system substrate-binding protein
MDQIQSDFLVIYLEDEKTRDDLRNDPEFQNIPAVKKGNYEFVGTVVTTALGGGVSALYWLLDRISPIVEKLK